METIENAKITKALLEIEDHGILTAGLSLDFGGVHTTFGGYSLYSPKSVNGDYTGKFIWGCLKTLNVWRWDELVGKIIRVKSVGYRNVVAIGHPIEDKWFNPSEELEK